MKKLLFYYITIILTLSTNNIILADDFFTEQRKTFINNYGKEEEYVERKLTPKYQKFVDKNGRILDIKELNKNGKYIFFENEDNKDDYYVILETTLGINKKINKAVCSIYAYCSKNVYYFLYDLHGESINDEKGYRFEVKLNLENFTYSRKIKLLDKYKNISKEEEKQYNYDMMRDDTIYDSDIKKVEWSTYEYNDIEKKMIELINSYKNLNNGLP